MAATAMTAVATLGLTGCGLAGGDDDKTITMIVTESAPYQEPTEIAKELLAEQGWTLETTYVTDIIQPNHAVQNGEYDVNFFQTMAYLRAFNNDNATDVEPIFSVYYGRAGFFSTVHDSIEDLPDGARVALPVDTANNGRALSMLAYEGVIEVDETVEPTLVSQYDITDNPKNLEFIEVDQQSVAQVLPDVDASFGFTRLIAEGGFDVDETALILESDENIIPLFRVVVGGPEEFRDTEAARVLQEAYQSPEVDEWFQNYQGGTSTFVDDVTVDNADEVWEDMAF